MWELHADKQAQELPATSAPAHLEEHARTHVNELLVVHLRALWHLPLRLLLDSLPSHSCAAST